uniref:KH homology domain-containing protein 4-like n=1 Tax=Ciona intestinalis TaxID=7719 RepID=UPI000180BF0D|nr:KH homology domain-containing protein 4-like [Ciona intestinalis]|eukprot:XP_002127162.1 KH homology domain-containing protein 4-like [Ciona intestinalis]
MSKDSWRQNSMPPRPDYGNFKAPSLPSANSNPAPKKTRISKFSDEPTVNSPPLNGNGGTSEKSRVSKFSLHPPSASIPSKSDPVAAAAAAAARINANLRAKGKLSDQTQHKPVVNTIQTANSALSAIQVSQIKKIFDLYVAKIDINNLPIVTRTYMTQVNAQEIINKQTGAAVSTKGQYLTQDEKKNVEGIDKQLHLYVQSPSQDKVELAINKIKDMISKHNVSKSSLSAVAPTMVPPMVSMPIPQNMVGQPSLPSGNYVHDKLFIGMDYVPPDFDLKTKLIGANYTNFNFVANSTGAKVILRGRGSGFIEPTSGREAFESMYVFISHPNQAGVDAAKKLVNNLIEHVRNEYNAHTRKTQSGFGNPQAAYPGNPPYGSNSVNYQPPSQFPSYPMGNIPPMGNPYMNYTQAPPNPYNMPQNITAHPNIPPPVPVPPPTFTPPTQPPFNPQATPNITPTPQAAPTSDMMPPPPPVAVKPTEPAPKPTKRRRFKEEQPDDSNILGYQQFSKNSDQDSKKTKRNFSEKSTESLPNTTVEKDSKEQTKSGSLPFWMSYD